MDTAGQGGGIEEPSRVAGWLLLAARDPKVADHEWGLYGATMLTCGAVFSAVRLPADMVHAAAGTDDPGEVGEYLDPALGGGAVLVDETSCHYYFLTPPNTPGRWSFPGTQAMGTEYFLWVPRPDITTANAVDRRTYWVLPMAGAGALCVPSAVMELAVRGKRRLEERAALGLDATVCRARCERALRLTLELPRKLPPRAEVDRLLPLLREDVRVLIPIVDTLAARCGDGPNKETAVVLVGRAYQSVALVHAGSDRAAAVHLEDLAHVARGLLSLVVGTALAPA